MIQRSYFTARPPSDYAEQSGKAAGNNERRVWSSGVRSSIFHNCQLNPRFHAANSPRMDYRVLFIDSSLPRQQQDACRRRSACVRACVVAEVVTTKQSSLPARNSNGSPLWCIRPAASVNEKNRAFQEERLIRPAATGVLTGTEGHLAQETPSSS